VGPPPASSEGSLYLLTVIDRSTQWVEAFTMTMEASTWVDAYIFNWVARFGVPCAVMTDRGTCFTLALWTGRCTRLGSQHILTTAYHLRSIWIVERLHRPCVYVLRDLPGFLTYHGCSWACMQPSKKTLVPLLQSRCWVFLSSSLESSCTCCNPHVSNATTSY
jgi:transposase InsO family protein